jgi:hypothetical protein
VPARADVRPGHRRRRWLIARWNAPILGKYLALVIASLPRTSAPYELLVRRFAISRRLAGMKPVSRPCINPRSLRLAPLTDAEAEEMIGELRTARLLDGFQGSPSVSHAAVRDVLVRLAALVDDVAQIAEMDLNPVICRGDDVIAVDVRMRVAPPPWHPDPLVRQLRPAQPAEAQPTSDGPSTAADGHR